MTDWTRLKPLPHPMIRGCLNCAPAPTVLPLSAVLATGFGIVTVTRDGEVVWSDDDEHVWLRRFERQAAKDPDHDWRVRFRGALSEESYQRQDGKWLLVQKGMGFA